MEGWHRAYSIEVDFFLFYPPETRMFDENLGTHRRAGEPIERPPSWLTLSMAANIVDWFEKTEMAKIVSIDQSSLPELEAAWINAATVASKSLAGRISGAALRNLWSGCLAASKALSLSNYWTGPIGSWERFLLFKCQILPECSRNPWYRIGALSAPIFKMNRRERITLRGVPLRTYGDPTFMMWEKIGAFES